MYRGWLKSVFKDYFKSDTADICSTLAQKIVGYSTFKDQDGHSWEFDIEHGAKENSIEAGTDKNGRSWNTSVGVLLRGLVRNITLRG